MSAPPQSRTLAPAWLVAPHDVNALAPLVWPSSATRDESGVLVVGGIPATRLHEQFGTPLWVIDEDEVRARAREALDAFRSAASR
ncbi:MAG: diaminopimelate decarboxylase, partial [Microbacterium sp.]